MFISELYPNNNDKYNKYDDDHKKECPIGLQPSIQIIVNIVDATCPSKQLRYILILLYIFSTKKKQALVI